MKLTPMGKLALFLLVLGLGFGGFKAYQRSAGKISANGGGGTQAGGASGTGSTGSDAVSNGGDSAGNSGRAPSTVGANELQIVTSASKRGWLNEQIDKFNAQSDVKLVPKL